MTLNIKLTILLALATISFCAIVTPIPSPPFTPEKDLKTFNWTKGPWAMGNGTHFPMQGHGFRGNHSQFKMGDHGFGGNHTGFPMGGHKFHGNHTGHHDFGNHTHFGNWNKGNFTGHFGHGERNHTYPNFGDEKSHQQDQNNDNKIGQ